MPLGFFDNAVDDWFRSNFGISTGLLLTGSIGALLFAYAVRFAAVALQTTNSAFSKISGNLDSAARVLGAKPGRLLFRVHLPIMRGSLLTAALIVFVEVVKELAGHRHHASLQLRHAGSASHTIWQPMSG